MKKIFLLIIAFNIYWGQTPLQGVNAYYSALSVASAGSAGLVPSIDSDHSNPAGIAILEPQINLGIIKYPANIGTQSVSYLKNYDAASFGVALRRINYGTFNAIDDNGLADGTYTASDTWISISCAKKQNKLRVGLSSGLFISNLESYNALALVMAAGFIYDLPKNDLQLGISMSNFGIYLSHYTNYKERVPAKIIFSSNKGLRYLPLNINFDISYFMINRDIFARIGGIFQLPYNFKLIFGINSDNLDQATEYKNVKSILGGSGIGISFTFKQYSLELGGYSYGSGGWIYGTSFNYLIN